MPGFQPFQRHTPQRAPRYFEGAMADERAKQMNRAQRFNEILGAFKLYDAATGDSTPISDFLRGGGDSAGSATDSWTMEEAASAADGSMFTDYPTTPAPNAATQTTASPGFLTAAAVPTAWAVNEYDAYDNGYRQGFGFEDYATNQNTVEDFSERLPDALGMPDNKSFRKSLRAFQDPNYAIKEGVSSLSSALRGIF